jgi:hypothetical protein
MSRILLVLLIAAAPLRAEGTIVNVEYPPSKEPGELRFGVTYTLWLPPDVKTLRGIIVHQHGCGTGACKGGETAAHDLHWQALAAKWDCALLGPSYHQKDGEDCQLWCDPRNGSRKAFLNSLTDLAAKTNHPELISAPWCLWGHSGGGVWASIMMASDPDRIAAVWLRSGTAFGRKIGDRTLEYPDAAYKIPVVANPGALEKGDKRFGGLYDASFAMHAHFRGKNAPFAVAVDPKSNHDCGESRYLAIPWFDACLKQRLPKQGTRLNDLDLNNGWLTSHDREKLAAVPRFDGRSEEANWLPDETTARIWAEFTKTGTVGDTTPPPAPTKVRMENRALVWECRADFESGLAGFIIEKDGREVARLPEKVNTMQPRPLFQGKSYHDTPEATLPKMTWTPPGDGDYAIIAVNGAGLRSTPTKLEGSARGFRR